MSTLCVFSLKAMGVAMGVEASNFDVTARIYSSTETETIVSLSGYKGRASLLPSHFDV